jgi:hypothetical protein
VLAFIVERSAGYWERLKEWAAQNSDGCTKAADIHVECCYEHDYHYVFGETLEGSPITKAEADVQFRRCIQSRSKLGKFSPMSWWRFAAVRLFGKGKWIDEGTV